MSEAEKKLTKVFSNKPKQKKGELSTTTIRQDLQKLYKVLKAEGRFNDNSQTTRN